MLKNRAEILGNRSIKCTSSVPSYKFFIGGLTLILLNIVTDRSMFNCLVYDVVNMVVQLCLILHIYNNLN